MVNWIKVLWLVYGKAYRIFRFGKGRFFIEPLLRMKIEGHSVGHQILNFVNSVIARMTGTFRDEIVIRTQFGAEICLPKGYRQLHFYLEGTNQE